MSAKDMQKLKDNSDSDNDLDNQITIIIKKLNGESFEIDCNENCKISHLKLKIFEQENMEISHQRLIFRAQELNDNETLNKYGIKNKTTIHIVIRRILPDEQQNNNQNNNNNQNININMNSVDNDFANAYGYDNSNNLANLDMNDYLLVNNIHRLCRFVRIFALIDGIFLLIYALTWTPFIVLSILAIGGYWGSKNLDRRYLILYIICLILEVGVRFFFIYIEPNAITIILYVLMILIDFFVLKCVISLYRSIPLLTAQQKQGITQLNRRLFF